MSCDVVEDISYQWEADDSENTESKSASTSTAKDSSNAAEIVSEHEADISGTYILEVNDQELLDSSPRPVDISVAGTSKVTEEVCVAVKNKSGKEKLDLKKKNLSAGNKSCKVKMGVKKIVKGKPIQNCESIRSSKCKDNQVETNADQDVQPVQTNSSSVSLFTDITEPEEKLPEASDERISPVHSEEPLVESPVKKRCRTSRNLLQVCSFSDDPTSEELSDEEEEVRPKRKRKVKTRKKDDPRKKSSAENASNELPSVYSSAEIRRHEKRLKRLKAMENESESESSENSSENENVDPDLDINLRIFESSAKSVENVIIGEIQCNVIDDKANPEDANEKGSKNLNVFKVSVNANFKETEEPTVLDQEIVEKLCESDEDKLESQVDQILSDNEFEFTSSDSDLEILISKALTRKRFLPVPKKEKPVVSADRKLTMYDLICDSMSSKNNKDDHDENAEEDEITDEPIELKNEKEEVIERIDLKEEEEAEEISSSHLSVPQLKVTADGEVVLDMDSLIIEQTGLSDARNAIANKQVIEECGFSHTSYNKRRGYPRQWTPQDTLKFYHVLSTIGTDFSLMATLFPGRSRMCMKRKFKREEKSNADLIFKALSCKQNFDMTLLEKELQLKEAQVNKLRENVKNDKPKKVPKKVIPIKKPTGRRKSFFEKGIQCFQDT